MISFSRASRIAYRVTARSASSMRYLNASTCFLSNAYSRTRPCCARSMRPHTSSSCCVLRTPPTALCFPYSDTGSTKDSAVPLRPARAVRPTRCVYARAEVGRSKLSTQATSRKSTPRATPYSASRLAPRRFFRAPGFFFAGEVDSRLRLRWLGPGSSFSSSSSASRWVEVTTVIQLIPGKVDLEDPQKRTPFLVRLLFGVRILAILVVLFAATLVRCNDIIIHPFVEFLHRVISIPISASLVTLNQFACTLSLKVTPNLTHNSLSRIAPGIA